MRAHLGIVNAMTWFGGVGESRQQRKGTVLDVKVRTSRNIC